MALKIKDENSAVIDTIRQLAAEIEQTKTDIKARAEMIKEIRERKPAYDEVIELTQQLQAAKTRLKAQLQNDAAYNDHTEDQANDRDKLKDQKDIMSQHIALYWKNTGERQVEMNDLTGDAREVVIVGKLGKEGKMQTSLFNGSKPEKLVTP